MTTTKSSAVVVCVVLAHVIALAGAWCFAAAAFWDMANAEHSDDCEMTVQSQLASSMYVMPKHSGAILLTFVAGGLLQSRALTCIPTV
mmetsp:Transcript_18400/g.44367  ORF Transcript_18400/g.44367 Transcript_18400/m.44367 type:complete len:88 (-) Transcript_18400:228-491(-)